MRYTAFLIGIITGFLLILLALFARVVGIDHDAAWGTSRYVLLFSGLGLVGASVLGQLYWSNRFPPAVQRAISAVIHAARGFLSRVCQNTAVSVGISILLLAGIAAYAGWYTSFGLFPRFTRVVNPYVDLGEAFLHGQAALLAAPDPRLASLANPYDYDQREEVPYLWDLSYYKGKYYAYWGPAPALLYAAVQAITGAPPPDQLGVLVFTLGLGIVLALFLFRARRRFFPRAPGISIPLFVLAALINLPLMHILERCQVYETSVIAGQFFLVLGLLALLPAMDEARPGWLLMTGLCWALAVASRYNLALSAGVLVIFALLQLWRSVGWSSHFRKQAAFLLAPLVICALALALYNYARFENPLETGLAYQLTVPVYQNRHFSAAYAPPGLYMYLFYPLPTSLQFPFFPSIPVDFTRLPLWAVPPKGWMFDEVFFGLLPSSPILWLLAVLAPLALASSAVSVWQRNRHPAAAGLVTAQPRSLRRMLALAFGLAGLAQFALLLFYYFNANRFLVDFLVLWLLGLVFLSWEVDEMLRAAQVLRALLWLSALLLALAGAGMAVLAGFDIVPQFFRMYNPAAYGAIAEAGNRVFAGLRALPESSGLFGALLRLLGRLAP